MTPIGKQIDVAFVFGSMASGHENNASDVDLMVIGDASLLDVVTALSEAQRELGLEINPNVYPRPEFCRKLRAGQHFIGRVMAGPKLLVAGDEQQLTGMGTIRVA